MATVAEAYLIGHISVKDANKWAEYRSRVPATLTPWGAELLFRSGRSFVLSGEHPYTDTVVIRFPNADAVRDWYRSPAYQELVPLREQAAELVLICCETEPPRLLDREKSR